MNHFSCEISYNQRNLLGVLGMHITPLCFPLNLCVHVCLLCILQARQKYQINKIAAPPPPPFEVVHFIFQQGGKKGLQLCQLICFLIFVTTCMQNKEYVFLDKLNVCKGNTANLGTPWLSLRLSMLSVAKLLLPYIRRHII